MTSKSFKTWFLLLTVLLLGSCEKETALNTQFTDGDKIVVEGLITSELKKQQIRLTRPYAEPNSTPGAVSGAAILVSSNEDVYRFSEDSARPGYYFSDVEFAGQAGKNYSLFISNNNTVISAKATMVQGTDFVFMRYVRNNKTNLFRIIWIANPYNAQRPAMYEILLDWSMVAGYELADPETTKARLLYYTLPTLDVSQIFAPEMESILFPPGTLITENRYSLTLEHAEYIRALLSETNWQGGLFNSVPANLPTNVSNNGIGYFGASVVTTKSEIARNIFSISEIKSPQQ
jgi:hypothetical protein